MLGWDDGPFLDIPHQQASNDPTLVKGLLFWAHIGCGGHIGVIEAIMSNAYARCVCHMPC
jgi:hypothetical protein